MLKSWLWVVAVFLLPCWPAHGQPPVSAGRIKIVSGAAFVVRGGELLPAQVGQVVYEADTLRTGADGQLGVALRDESRISMGPASELRLARFAFAPADNQFGLVLSILRGVVVYVSGRLAKLASDSIRLETPDALVGVRGTTVALRVSG